MTNRELIIYAIGFRIYESLSKSFCSCDEERAAALLANCRKAAASIYDDFSSHLPRDETGTREMPKQAPLRRNLEALLKRAAGHKMTREEREAQRKSWVIGEMMLDRPEMTREEAERIYNEARDA